MFNPRTKKKSQPYNLRILYVFFFFFKAVCLDDGITENSIIFYKFSGQSRNSYLWCTDKFSSFVCWKSTDEISIDVASNWSTSIIESSVIFPRVLLNESSLVKIIFFFFTYYYYSPEFERTFNFCWQTNSKINMLKVILKIWRLIRFVDFFLCLRMTKYAFLADVNQMWVKTFISSQYNIVDT